MRKMTYVRLWAVLLMAVLLPQAITAKVVMNFKEIVTGSEKVAATFTDGVITGPEALMERIGTAYTLKSTNTTSVNYKRIGLVVFDVKSSNSNKFTVAGLQEGDQVVFVLSDGQAGRLTTAGANTCLVNGVADNYTEVAKAVKNGAVTFATITATGSEVTVIDKAGWTVIERIEITPAQEAAESETIAAPVISSMAGEVTVTAGSVTNKKEESQITTYYTIDGSMPSADNGTAFTGDSKTFSIELPTLVKAVTVSTSGAVSNVATAIVSPQSARAASIDLTTLNADGKQTLTSSGVKASSYTYAAEHLAQLYGTLAFNNPAQWTLSESGLKCAAVNNYFEIPNLKEGDRVTFTITTGRLQLYNQSTSTHLVDGKTPSDGYANIAKAGDYAYEVTMLCDGNLKIAPKDEAVTIAAVSIAEKEEEHYEMPDVRTEAPQNRGLWACQTVDGSKTFVSWRARKTDTDATTYILYRNGNIYDTFTSKTNVTIDGTADSYATDTYRMEVVVDGSPVESMSLAAGSVKPRSWMRIALADEPVVTNTGVMWNKDGVDDGYKVRYTPDDMSCCDMDGDGQEELIVKWNPSNALDNGYSGYTANVYIDCYKMDYAGEGKATLMWRINLGQNIRAGAHYTQFLCYDFDGDGRGEMMVKTSLGTKDGLGNYVFQSRIAQRGLDVTRDYTRQDDSGTAQKSNGHIGVGEEWLTVFDGVTGRELATIDYYPKFNVVSDWHEPEGSANRYNKGTRFRACVAFLDGRNPSGVFNRGYYSQSFFTAYNWNGTNLYEVWRHESKIPGEGLYGQGNHSLVVADMDGDGFDEIGTGSAVLDHDGTVLWTSGFGHGDALHLGDFDPENEGLEIFYVNEEYGESPYSTALFDARTGQVLKGLAQTGMDTGRGLAADVSAAHRGAELFSKGDNDKNGETYLMAFTDGSADWMGGNGDKAWQNGSLVKGFTSTDEVGNSVANEVASYPNFRIYWDGTLQDNWMDSRHVDRFNDETRQWERVYTFDTPLHPAHSLGGSKETPCLQTDLFGDWREEAVFYDYDVLSTEKRDVVSKSEDQPATIDWDVRQYYLVIFTTTIPTEHRLPWLRDDHAYDMSIVWQNVGYNQPPHLSFSPAEVYGKQSDTTTGIDSVNREEMKGNEAVYNLSGQRVARPLGGIYIKGGKKLYIRK